MAFRNLIIPSASPVDVCNVNHDVLVGGGTIWNDGPEDCKILWMSRDADGDETIIAPDHFSLIIQPGGYLEIPPFVFGVIQAYAEGEIEIKVSMRDEKAFEEID